MSQKEIAYKIEELQIKAEKIDSLQAALFTAVFRQEDFAVETYEWAFVLLADMTAGMKNELEELTNRAFENFRRGEKEKKIA